MRIALPEAEAFSTLVTTITGKEPRSPITGISTDSRECITGDLYVALKGEQVDGHEFIKQAVDNGAVAVICEKGTDDSIEIDYFFADDPLEFMGTIARGWRRQFDIPVIGVTGSNGKTSTKELLKHIFSKSETVHATEGNFNTSIGLPLTLMQLSRYHTLSIIEMGANRPGDIAHNVWLDPGL